jgi:hypothetical protein
MSLPALHLHQLRPRARGRLDPRCRKRDPDTGACRSPHNEQTPDPIKEKLRTDVEHTAGLEESEQSDQAEPDCCFHECDTRSHVSSKPARLEVRLMP